MIIANAPQELMQQLRNPILNVIALPLPSIKTTAVDVIIKLIHQLRLGDWIVIVLIEIVDW